MKTLEQQIVELEADLVEANQHIQDLEDALERLESGSGLMVMVKEPFWYGNN